MTFEDLPEANRAGDPSAGAPVTELLDSGRIPHVNGIFRSIGTLATLHPQLPPRLEEFLREAAAAPDWAAEDVCRADPRISHHHGTVSMMQATVGLMSCCRYPAEVFTLGSTGSLGGRGGPGRRLSQSSRLFMGIGSKHALDRLHLGGYRDRGAPRARLRPGTAHALRAVGPRHIGRTGL
ncbi:hypothetical protein P1P70_06340 [Streptomyces sp. MB09-02B]|nr:hypothetical protein [Streptomyces sp. MB09-02B]